MRKLDSTFEPLSLAQHFDPPEDFIGCFGWICGYSADAGFMDDAVERFTRRMHNQRAYAGRISLALMLDRSNAQITPKEVPGVIHLGMKGVPPFRLLHAKFAFLGFRHTSDARGWRLRLIISTGNWTRQTLEESLDLAWRIDVGDQDVKSQDDSVVQACADLGAAWKTLDWLRRHFDFGVLNARTSDRQDSESESTIVEKWIAKAIRLGTGKAPRFFDNRNASLLEQLPRMVQEHASRSPRNYLGMGSGFYESSNSKTGIPSVLRSVVETLQQSGLLTRQPAVDIFVNPRACQAVAHSVPSIHVAGWKVREAGLPGYFQPPRSLHAKFIFSAIDRENSQLCNSAWLYLGSGNLTGPGFANRMAPQSGNLEAGVVFKTEPLRWIAAKGNKPESVLTNLLPVQWETDLSEGAESLSPGSDMPDPEVRYIAPPVAYFFWIVQEGMHWLQTSEEAMETFDVLDEAGDACLRDQTTGFAWQGQMPRQVQVRWCGDGQEQRAWVPVIDEYGRVAATILPRIGIEEAWNQLANFPMPPEEEELLADGDAKSTNGGAHINSGPASAASYPVRQIMQLLENIAAKQTSVAKADWVTWCTRLEQSLIQSADDTVIQAFLKLKLNPLSALWHLPFRPAFASTRQTVEGLRYEIVLERVETEWKVAGLTGFGDPV